MSIHLGGAPKPGDGSRLAGEIGSGEGQGWRGQQEAGRAPRVLTPEHRRLEEADKAGVKWRRWGTYLSERQWGTVREDYSPNGDAWTYFTHEQARMRAY